MAISNQDRDRLTRWGHMVAHARPAMWSEADREEALRQFSLFYHLAEDDRERFSVVWCFHEGYRQHHNVRESDVADMVLPMEALAITV